MIASSKRLRGDLAGVFEHDGDTGHFYLFNLSAKTDQKVVAAIWVMNGEPDFDEHDVEVRWDPSGNAVGLLIRGRLWAVHDLRSGAKHGGNYRSDHHPAIPEGVSLLFKSG